MKPDVLVVATGAVPIIPDVPGVGGENVVLATDVLLGRKSVGERVVVIGGGEVGVEVTIHLWRRGRRFA